MGAPDSQFNSVHAHRFRKIKHLLIREPPSTQPEAEGNVGTMQAAGEENSDHYRTTETLTKEEKEGILKRNSAAGGGIWRGLGTKTLFSDVM